MLPITLEMQCSCTDLDGLWRGAEAARCRRADHLAVPHSLVLLHPAARERWPPVTEERLQPGTTGPDDEDGYHLRTSCGALIECVPTLTKEGMHTPKMFTVTSMKRTAVEHTSVKKHASVMKHTSLDEARPRGEAHLP